MTTQNARQISPALFLFLLFILGCASESSLRPEQAAPPPPRGEEAELLSGVRQLTFVGSRSGEGYYSSDGRRLVFQSERDPKNPFYQIYLLDFCTGEVKLVSPGYGKTTCAWIHPDGGRILFASTHHDPGARLKQQRELELRASNKTRRYSWDFDDHYELYALERYTNRLTRLSNAPGYDAEGSYSPDGKSILFASNRHAYMQQGQTEGDEQTVDVDESPSFHMDLYRMNADGSGVTRLTNSPGYDGGPFYSADGSMITWRRFGPDGRTAEVFVMNADGSNQRKLTDLGALSWAPYFHPSGDYLIFASNLEGYSNFELYITRTDGQSAPIRVTYTDGFDGLPVFSPDGNTLAWTSKRTANGTTQIFLGDWNDAQARVLLGLKAKKPRKELKKQASCGFNGAIGTDDLKRFVTTLASPEMEGRRTGSAGEAKAAEFAAARLEAIGLEPAGENRSYFQTFSFTSHVSLGEENFLEIKRTDLNTTLRLRPENKWQPLSYSKTGPIAAAPVVFAGYGIVAPAVKTEKGVSISEYDSYTHLDVKDKWVMIFRGLPERASKELHAHLARHGSLRYKAMVARNLGAKGIIVVNGPLSKAKNELISLHSEAPSAPVSLAGISVKDELAEKLLESSGKTLKELQESLINGRQVMGFALPDLSLAASIDIRENKGSARNVLAKLPANPRHRFSAKTIVLGAHLDHLGKGAHPGSLGTAKDAEEMIHFGADDNASGVAAVLEIAEELRRRVKAGTLEPRNNLIIALWSGEEIGLLGSSHYVESLSEPERTSISAYVNLDMVGRLENSLILQGVGSSPDWLEVIEGANAAVSLPLNLQNDSYLPTDATSFYLKKIPILSAFTGAHSEYHTPRDTPDTLNYEGLQKIARMLSNAVAGLLRRETPLEYAKMEKPEHLGRRAHLRAYLGTIPDYGRTDIRGVAVSGVAEGSPAQSAGLTGGDIIIELDEKSVENIYDYTYAIEGLKIDTPVLIKFLRDGKEHTSEIIPASRE